ncbi:MAG: hypothetical protein HOW73_00265 [Polyangiaceae bacterium]|nr:hypothetical protein [Polyangiaceae bacterium]
MLQPFESNTARQVRRNRLWLAAGLAPFALMIPLVASAVATGNYAMLAGLFHLTILGFVTTMLVLARHPHSQLAKGAVAVNDGVVTVGGARLTSREELRQGVVVPRSDGVWVKLDRKGRKMPYFFRVRDVAEGRAMLRSLGFDATQSTAEFRCLSPLFTKSLLIQLALSLGPLFVGMALAGGLGTTLLGPKGAALAAPGGLIGMVFLFVLLLSPTRVRVGADGIVTRWLGRSRFYRYGDLESVEPWEANRGGKRYMGIAIRGKDGSVRRIAAAQKGWNEGAAKQLEERVAEAIEAHRAGVKGADVSALGRAGRAYPDWVAHLRSVGEGATAGLRNAFVPLDALLRLVEDPTQPALVRASAAVAAAPKVGADGRDRIRIAASTTASPKLRFAIEQSLADQAEDVALGEALAEVEAEERSTFSRRPTA